MGNEAGKTNVWAILGLVFAFVFAPLGLVFSIVALTQLKKHPDQTGKGLAIAGLVVSIVFVVIWIIMMVFWFAIFASMMGMAGSMAAYQ